MAKLGFFSGGLLPAFICRFKVQATIEIKNDSKTKKHMLQQQQQQQTDSFSHPSNQEEYDAAIQSSPLTLVEIYASWCGPCKCFKAVMSTLPDTFSYVQVPHGTIQKYTAAGTLADRKNSCQPTFLILDTAGKLLHLQHGLVMSELARLIREHLKSVTKWSSQQSQEKTSEEHETGQGGGASGGGGGGGSGGGGGGGRGISRSGGNNGETQRVGRRSSMKVDSTELRRRNSIASTGLKNAFKSTTKRRMSTLGIVSEGNNTSSEDSNKNFKNTMQGLNSIQKTVAASSS